MTGHSSILTAKGRKGPLTGADWDRYLIGDLLGQGGMAAVYLAHVKESNKQVALKVMLGQSNQDPDARRRFEREAETASHIDSPFVVRVYHAGSYHDMLYMELEYVSGDTLASVLQDNRKRGYQMGRAQILRYAREVSFGLQAASEYSIIHRDIKPSNLLIGDSGAIKISDFGVVKVFGEETLTMTGMAIGTPTYMSPEQARNDEVDLRADMYSLGVVLYEACCGSTPFTGTSPEIIIYKHHYEEPVLPTELNAECDADLEALIIKCLQKEPEKRYPGWKELLEDIDELEAQRPPVHAVFKRRRHTGADEMLRQAGFQRRRLLILAIILLSLGIITGLTYWLVDQRNKSIAALRVELAELDHRKTPAVDAQEDLESLLDYVGPEDADVQRWQKRLKDITAYREAVQLINKEVDVLEKRQNLPQALDRLASIVGDEDLMVSSGRLALHNWQGEEERLREELQVLDEEHIEYAVLLGLSGVLERFALLVGHEHKDMIRWRTKLKDIMKRVEQSVAIVNRSQADGLRNLSEHQALILAVEDLSHISGDQQEHVRLGRSLLADTSSRIDSLRRSLLVLDQKDFISEDLRAVLMQDLRSYAALIGEQDPQALAWQKKLFDMQAEQERLQALLRLRLEAVPQANEFSVLRAQIMTYQQLSVDDEKTIQVWQEKLDQLEQQHKQDRSFLNEALLMPLLSQRSSEALLLVLDRLRELAAVSAEEQQAAQLLLAHSQNYREDLRRKLQVLDEAQALPLAVDDLLKEYRAMVTQNDEEFTRWSQKLARVRDLESKLSVLDRQQRHSSTTAAFLEELALLIGEQHDQLQLWREEFLERERLYTALLLLDKVQTEPADADLLLEQWVQKLGPYDSDAQRWSQHLARIKQLRTWVRTYLSFLVLGPDARADVQHLADLVGESDSLVRDARAHLAHIRPSVAPLWAEHFVDGPYNYKASFTVAGEVFTFCYIPAHSVLMGSSTDEIGRDVDEPQREVQITRAFWLLETEITQAQWQALLGKADWFNVGMDLPADHRSLADAEAFCIAFEQEGGIACRLPTEAEWSLACRADVDINDVDPIDRRAWYAGNAQGSSHAVAQLQPNRFGLYDMLGNVWEWCADAYGELPADGSVNPLRKEGAEQVIRGASWGDQADSLRWANRGHINPRTRSAYVGFRVLIEHFTQE